MKIALQTAAVDKFCQQHGAYETFRRAAALGFTAAELSQHIQVSDETIPEIARASRDFGIEISALSTGFDGPIPQPAKFNPFPELAHYSIENDMEKLVGYCRALNCRSIRFAGLPHSVLRTRADVELTLAAANDIAVRLEAQGIHFCMHNHWAEFMQVEGKTLWDYALELAPDLCFELDILWAQRGGKTPADLIRRAGRRVVLLHGQDLGVFPPSSADERSARFQGVEIGEGNMDMAAILQACVDVGSEYFMIEQSQFNGRDPFDCLAVSLSNVRALGFGQYI